MILMYSHWISQQLFQHIRILRLDEEIVLLQNDLGLAESVCTRANKIFDLLRQVGLA